MLDVDSLRFAGIVSIIATAALFTGGIFVLAYGAKTWGDAVAGMHRARAHRAQADTEETVQAEAAHALDETRQRRTNNPVAASDRELRDAILAERASTNGHVEEYTTEGNEGIEESPPIPEGGFYR